MDNITNARIKTEGGKAFISWEERLMIFGARVMHEIVI